MCEAKRGVIYRVTSFHSSCINSCYPSQVKLVSATACRVGVAYVFGVSFSVVASFFLDSDHTS